MSSLKTTSFRGVTWSFVDKIAGNGISFVIGIILARLLSPTVFGLIGMVTAFFSIANTFIDSGFSTGLIRKVQCSNEEYNTVFYFNIVISSFIYFLLFIFAPTISFFFKEPQLISLIRILSCVIVIDSVSVVQRTILTREINFKLQTKISLVASISSGVIGIIMAYGGFGVWSLVVQLLIKQVLSGLLLWFLSKWRPTANFSVGAFKELFEFGSKLLGSGLLISVQNNVFYIVIGKYFTAAGLGFYTRAEQFNALIIGNITGTFDRVFFSVLSSIQNDEKRLILTLKKMLRTSFFITFFSLITMAIIAKPLIYLIIGDKWAQSVIYLQLLCIGSIFYPFDVVNLNILILKGRSDLILKNQIIKTILTLIIIISGILFGITVMLIVRILTMILGVFLNGRHSFRLLGYSVKDQFIDIVPYLISEVVIFLFLISINYLPFGLNILFFIQLFSAIILFVIIFEGKKHSEYLDIKHLIINQLFPEYSKP